MRPHSMQDVLSVIRPHSMQDVLSVIRPHSMQDVLSVIRPHSMQDIMLASVHVLSKAILCTQFKRCVCLGRRPEPKD